MALDTVGRPSPSPGPVLLAFLVSVEGDPVSKPPLRALLIVGVVHDAAIVIRAAGLDLHGQPEWLRRRLAIITEPLRNRRAGR